MLLTAVLSRPGLQKGAPDCAGAPGKCLSDLFPFCRAFAMGAAATVTMSGHGALRATAAACFRVFRLAITGHAVAAGHLAVLFVLAAPACLAFFHVLTAGAGIGRAGGFIATCAGGFCLRSRGRLWGGGLGPGCKGHDESE